MKGYIFEYYKYVRYTKETLKPLRDNDILPYDEAEASFLTFGEFDRLKVNTISNISRYRDLSTLAKSWIGNRQSLLFYALDEQPELIYREEVNPETKYINVFGFFNTKTNKYDKHLFLGLTQFPFVSQLRENMQDYGQLLLDTKKCMEELIVKLTSKKGYEMSFVILGNLGVFGITVLWFTDQYTHVLNTVNYIKNHMENYFLSAYTIFSKNHLEQQEYGHRIDEICGKALVQFTLKRHLPEDMMYKASEVVREAMHTSGLYDVVLKMDAKDVYCRFEEDDRLNHDNDNYQKFILQTRVTLGEDMQTYDAEETLALKECENDELVEKKSGEESELSTTLKEIKKQYDEVRNRLKQTFAKETGIADTFDSLLCDYRYNVVSAVNENWANDFSHVFKKNIECIGELCKYYEDNKQSIINQKGEDILAVMRILMNNLKQQIFHIAEANSLNFEVPKCHLRYTGQEDSIMFCYMGIIKEILETAYQLDSVNFQTEIVPIVTVDTVPIIDSDLYFDKTLLHNNKFTDKDQTFKILSINLPHVSFFDIPTYMAYLYHEIYHYVVPQDRERRDYYIGILLTSMFYQKVFKEVIEEILKNNSKAEWVCEYITPTIFRAVVEKYDCIHTSITAEVETTNRDVVLFIAEVYKERLCDYLKDDIKAWAENRNSVLKEIAQKVNEYLENETIENISYKKMKKKRTLELNHEDDLKRVVCGIREGWCGKDFDNNKKKIVFYLERYQDILNGIMNGIKEVSADIPMIELADMSLEEYLLSYINCLKNLMITPETLQYSVEHKELLRLKMVMQYYQKKGVCPDGIIFQKLQDRYLAQTITIHDDESDGKGILQKLLDAKNELQKWWNKLICEGGNLGDIWYGVYRQILDALLEEASIEKRNHIYQIKDRSAYYFGAYRQTMNQYAKILREIEEKIHMGLWNANALKYYINEIQKFEEMIFSENIKLFQYFQQQKRLSDVADINTKNNSSKAGRNEQGVMKVIPSIIVKIAEDSAGAYAATVSDMNDLMREMEYATKKIKNDCRKIFKGMDCALWYRGQANSSYGLLPTIMRKGNDNRYRRKRDFNYLAQYQRHLFEEFKYRADGAPEIMDRSQYSISDYLALMQHYEVYTNLLDWSEDAFTGLYFALEDLIIADVEEVKEVQNDPCIQIFSPHLYNRARSQMVQQGVCKLIEDDEALRASLLTMRGNEGELPNIAAKYNESIYDMFLLGNVKYEKNCKFGYTDEIKLEGGREMAFLPLAVYTSRLNPRIRSQSGMFLAYNLYAEPGKEGEYTYLELGKIQDYYLKRFREEGKQFLYTIKIKNTAVKDIANCFKALGLSKERIYPELVNVSGRIR